MMDRGISDIGASLQLSYRNASIKTALSQATEELSSGEKRDLIEATNGNLGRLFAIERTLTQLRSEAVGADVAAGKAALAQMSLGVIQESLIELGPNLLSAVERGDERSSRLIAEDANHSLDTIFSSLNVRYGRHTVFSGASVDQQAVSASEVLKTDISAIVSGSPDASAALASIDAYFYSVGGGFEANVYLGAASEAPPYRSADGTKICYALRADDNSIRDAVRSVVIASVGAEFASAADRATMFREAGHAAISASGTIIELKESLGHNEGNIDVVRAKNQAMSSFFELELNAIKSVDPYEAATKFETLQGQLQTMYALTARLSGLSLANFLR